MIRHGIFALLVAATGWGCIQLGERGARALERLLIDRVENGWEVLEIDWAEMRADGMHLELHGHAPDSFAQELALESARATAPIAVVIDHSSVTLAPPPYREPIRVEILRDENGLTMTGRFHGEQMRASLIAALKATAPGLEIHDLTGINAARPDADWGPELRVTALAAARVSNAFVRIEPGAVRVGGLVRDADHRQTISMELVALTDETVQLTLQLRVPLVVAAPFIFAVVKDISGGLRLEACSARSVEEEVKLEAMLNRLGIELGEVRCPAALGGPTGDWAGAAEAGLKALGRLPAGRFRLEYHTAGLEGMVPTGAAELEAALVALAMELKDGFVLLGKLDAGGNQLGQVKAAVQYWMRFERISGKIVLSGAVPDKTARQVVETYAAAIFGQAKLHSVLTLAGEGVPVNWESAALVALDALGRISEGEVELSPKRIFVRGVVPGPAEAGRLQRLMEGEAPQGYSTESALRVDLPAQVAAVALSISRCAVVLSAAVKALPIAFAPGSAVFGAGNHEALDRLEEIFHRCKTGRIEIGGHTDSQGSERLNQRLSQARAEAVLDALIVRGVLLDRLSARGYGEGRPVASNETEAGRALNRRIEFSALEQVD
jgi:OOP family OmpA-OmpF porin